MLVSFKLTTRRHIPQDRSFHNNADVRKVHPKYIHSYKKHELIEMIRSTRQIQIIHYKIGTYEGKLKGQPDN
jgi:hypothetical protein